MANAKRLDSRFLNIAGFVFGHHFAAVVAQGARRIEITIESGTHECAIAAKQWRIVDERRIQRFREIARNPRQPYVAAVAMPKIRKLREHFSDRLKNR